MEEEKSKIIIRYASKEDIAAIAEDFIERVNAYGNHFWLMFDNEKLIAFADGFVTDEADLTDEMYEDAAMHNEKWRMADDLWSQYFAGLS